MHGTPTLRRDSNASRPRSSVKSIPQATPQSSRSKTPPSRSPSISPPRSCRSRPKSGGSIRSRSRSGPASETDRPPPISSSSPASPTLVTVNAEEASNVAVPTPVSSLSSVNKCVESVFEDHDPINLLDTRSKTINSVMRRPESAPVDSTRDIKPVPKSAASATKQEKNNDTLPQNMSGYGAPLVTPVHKKLYLRCGSRAYIPPASSPVPVYPRPGAVDIVKEKSNRTLPRPQSPPKADYSQFWATALDDGQSAKKLKFQKDLVLSGILNVYMLRIVQSVTQLCREVVLMVSFIAIGALFWVVGRRAEPPPWNSSVRMDKSPERSMDKPDLRDHYCYVPQGVKSYHSPQRENSLVRPNPKNLSLSTTNSMLRCQREKQGIRKTGDTYQSIPSKHGALKPSLRPASPVYFSSITRPTTPVHTNKTTAVHTMSNALQKVENNDYRHGIESRGKMVKPKASKNIQAIPKPKESPAKQLQEKFKPVAIGRLGSANHSIKSFKPKLEDIKSSFLLLNKDQTQNVTNAKKFVFANKPKPFNEEERRKKLEEVKKNFQSKKFFDDSKYDKIEGLNWISWK